MNWIEQTIEPRAYQEELGAATTRPSEELKETNDKIYIQNKPNVDHKIVCESLFIGHSVAYHDLSSTEIEPCTE